MEVLDSIHEDGPKLVEMSESAELNLRLSVQGMMVVPVVYYQLARAMPRVERGAQLAGAVPTVAGVRVRVRAQGTGTPIQSVKIVAFTDFERREGGEGVSDDQGEVAALPLRPGMRLQRLYAFPEAGYWGSLKQEVILSQQHDIELRPIALDDPGLLLSRYYGALPASAGSGVTVAVVDSGIAPHHPALSVTGGLNMVFDETGGNPGAEGDWGPARTEGAHGTHVAGIVGGHPIQGWRGIAPGVSLRSYRVIPHTGGLATNYDITKAIDRAGGDGCHIINLSLGGLQPDQAVRAAIDRALAQGALVVVAAGNDRRSKVTYPAAWPASVAVSAMGRRGSFPIEASEIGDIMAPFGERDQDTFIAQFSNIGPEIDVTGPGVGIVSTVPDDRYGVMDGTSMASPAVAGFAAYLLAANPHILNMQGEERSRALKTLLFQKAQTLGFGRNYEGFGLPMEAAVA
jgi:subtilisin